MLKSVLGEFCSTWFICVIVKYPWECLSETQLIFDRSLNVKIVNISMLYSVFDFVLLLCRLTE